MTLIRRTNPRGEMLALRQVMYRLSAGVATARRSKVTQAGSVQEPSTNEKHAR
jgi:hypothetical protein